MKAPWLYMTRGDWLIIITLLTLSLSGIVWVVNSPRGARVVVTRDGETCFTAPLGQSRSADIDGPLGQTHLVIDGDGARITSSPCPRKICISMGTVNQAGELLACVPNRILVHIENTADKEAPYDLLSR